MSPDGTAEIRPPLPPFTMESAIAKVRAAEDAWNSKDPARVAPLVAGGGDEVAAEHVADAARSSRAWQRPPRHI